MDPISVYGISSSVSAVAGSPFASLLGGWLSTWYSKRKLKRRCSGLLLLKGVSTLCQKLTTSNVLYLDCDKLYQQLNAPSCAEDLKKKEELHNPVDAYLAYPIIKNHVLNISSVFKQRIVLVSKNIDLLHSMPIYESAIHFFAFDKSMEANVGNIIYDSEKEHHESIVSKFRALQNMNASQVTYVSSMAELYLKVAEKYHSKVNEV